MASILKFLERYYSVLVQALFTKVQRYYYNVMQHILSRVDNAMSSHHTYWDSEKAGHTSSKEEDPPPPGSKIASRTRKKKNTRKICLLKNKMLHIIYSIPGICTAS